MRQSWPSALVATTLIAASSWAQTGTIAGVVVDNVHNRPLAGATVRVDGSDRVATTDSSGHFVVQGISVGRHRLTWRHPALDSLGLTMQSVDFDVPVDDTVRVSLARPSPRALVAALCGTTDPGVLSTGRVTRVDSDQPVAGATVAGAWKESGPVQRTATTDSVGRYRLCVPAAHELMVHASLDADAHTYLPPSPQGTVLIADLKLGAAADHASATISGQVLADSTGPVSGASVTILGTRVTGTTNRNGQFRLVGLPSGTQVLVVRSVGMEAFVQTVDLSAHAARVLTVSLRRAPPKLPTVNVVATPQQLADTYKKIGFTERQRIGIGRFLTQDDIRKNAGHTTADALNGYGGIYIGDNGDHGVYGDAVEANEDQANNSTSRPCTVYIVDGEILGEDDFTRGLPPPEQVIAIEIYRQAEPKPIKVSFGADVCAEVLVWTKAELTEK